MKVENKPAIIFLALENLKIMMIWTDYNFVEVDFDWANFNILFFGDFDGEKLVSQLEIIALQTKICIDFPLYKWQLIP